MPRRFWIFGSAVNFQARLLRLFLIATIPLLIAVHVQAAIGLGRINVIAVSALVGALINLPLSFVLTLRLGVSGVIWGTVLTTLFSNLLVPAIYTFRVLEMQFTDYLKRTLSAPMAGALALLIASQALITAGYPADPRGDCTLSRLLPFLVHLSVGCLAYAFGYLITPAGRQDGRMLWVKLIG